MAPSSLPAQRQPEKLLLRPTRGLASLNLHDLWVYRELVYFLTWRDIIVRYKQTMLGAAWAIIRPVTEMVIFTLVFNRLAGLSAGDTPYEIFNFTALLPWGLFSKAVSDAGRSLVNNRNMITKVYFPRLVIPFSSVLSGLVDFGIGFIVLLGLIAYFHFSPGQVFNFQFTPALLTLPLFVLLTLITALGASLWFSAMNVIYRDVAHVLPFLSQVWFYATPIVYSYNEISPQWQWLLALNPMTGVVEGFRWALLGSAAPSTTMLVVSIVLALVMLVGGMFYFRNMERTFADEI